MRSTASLPFASVRAARMTFAACAGQLQGCVPANSTVGAGHYGELSFLRWDIRPAVHFFIYKVSSRTEYMSMYSLTMIHKNIL